MSSERILIVEDEKIIALDLQRRLDKHGFSVVSLAADADDAVAKALIEKPDIILMDIMLGGVRDGIDAAEEIKSKANIPIVFLTAYADEQTVERAKHVEPVGYVLKPFKERELQTTINIALYKARVDQKLREQEEFFETLLQTITDGLISVDQELKVSFMNPVAEELTGFHNGSAVGRSVHDVFVLRDDHTDEPAPLPYGDAEIEGELGFENVYITNAQRARIAVTGSITPTARDAAIRGTLIAFRDVTDIKQMSRVIEYQASHDSLTGLVNREQFFIQLQEIARDALDNRKIHSFVYIDLDQFKLVNDVAGHLAGDELLRQVSEQVTTIIDSEHIAARLGGDEFGLLLLETPLSKGLSIANRLLENLEQKFIWQKNAFNISASIGVVPVAGVNAVGYNILAAADDACYLAKEAGGNNVKVYETADYTFLKRRGEMQWISRLTRALEEDRFELWGQAIASTSEDHYFHTEVLIRLKDSESGLISPGDFIPAAEKYNLMPSVDRWVVRKAFEHIRARELDGSLVNGQSGFFSVNLSGSSIADEGMLGYVRSLLDEFEIAPRRVCFEVTETTAIANLSRALQFMKNLKQLGVQFALDDFGNGFSSFGYLKKLPVDYLKIDGSFVKGLTTDPTDRALVEAVNRIGHVMGMKTIAEFVKDQPTRAALTEIGVDFLQGYDIARPARL